MRYIKIVVLFILSLMTMGLVFIDAYMDWMRHPFQFWVSFVFTVLEIVLILLVMKFSKGE